LTASILTRVRSRLRFLASIRLPALIGPHLPRAIRERLIKGEPNSAEGQWLRAVMIPDTRSAFQSRTSLAARR
jgi:hypothetical protein